VPEDDEGGWYRFHPLFAQLLRVELGRRDPALPAMLHQRAYAWHRDHGSVAEAVDHAIEAGLYDDAAELVASSWLEQANAGRDAVVELWLDRFPESVRDSDPRLLLALGWLQWLAGRHDEIEGTIASIERVPAPNAARSTEGHAEVAAGLATLKATLPRGVARTDPEVLRAVASIPRGSVWRPAACWAIGLDEYGRGELAEADRWFAEAVELSARTGQVLAGGSSMGYRSLIAGERGDKDAQLRLADQALEFMRVHGLEDVGVDAWHAVGVALAGQGRFVEARPVLARSVAVARFRGQPILVARALRSHAAVLRELGDVAEASRAEEEAASILDSTPDVRMIASRALRSRRVRPSRSTDAAGGLTGREVTVLQLLRSDLSESEIARQLFVSHSTVHSHARSIYRKLDVSSRAEALRRAREVGILSAD
jgi:LuxR family maltose regulon positive regulatory protein